MSRGLQCIGIKPTKTTQCVIRYRRQQFYKNVWTFLTFSGLRLYRMPASESSEVPSRTWRTKRILNNFRSCSILSLSSLNYLFVLTRFRSIKWPQAWNRARKSKLKRSSKYYANSKYASATTPSWSPKHPFSMITCVTRYEKGSVFSFEKIFYNGFYRLLLGACLILALNSFWFFIYRVAGSRTSTSFRQFPLRPIEEQGLKFLQSHLPTLTFNPA